MIRYCMNQVTSSQWTFEKDVAFYTSVGIPAIVANRRKLEAYGVEKGLKLLRDSKLKVPCYSSLGYFTLSDPGKWAKELDVVKQSLEVGNKMGAESVLLMTGPPAQMSYEETESRFMSVLEKLLPLGQSHKLPFLLEPVSPSYQLLGFVHTLNDGLDLVEKVKSPWLKVCYEMSTMWIERGMYDNIAKRSQYIGLVQINDVRPGIMDQSRIALGDGVVPVERIIRAFDKAGYKGYFDIEILGPAVEEMGCELTIRKSMEWMRKKGFA